MKNINVSINVFLIVLSTAILSFFSPSNLAYAQDSLKARNSIPAGLNAELKNDGSLWIRNYVNERGETQQLTVFDLKEEDLKAVTQKNSISEIGDKDIVAKFNISGKPVIIFKHGVIAIRRLSMESVIDHVAWISEISSANILPYPGKENWGILELNGKKELVIFIQRGSDKLLRSFNTGKDPS